MSTRGIEVMFLQGCPAVQLAVDRARDAIEAAGTHPNLHVIRIEGDLDARQRRFLGSPTVRVDGTDVDPSAVGRTDFGMRCRVYMQDDRIEEAPPGAWIEAALKGVDPSAPLRSVPPRREHRPTRK